MPRTEYRAADCFIEHETEKAILVAIGSENCWLPKSQVSYEKNPDGTMKKNADGTVTITSPEWLLREKGLI
jgi:hypothetical protein